ncbi:MAG: hypothetical protein J0G96_12140 [Flavobacteriia bacterium]|nr:hypothetical protein [Flavobacteriia bacterium]OJX34845.1 MAG: hypothetical protein BGO87_08855 [Flavobacteriia bacterium 40-80]
MKKIVTLLFLTFSIFSAYAQSPEKMSYQAVVRNSNNSLLISQSVGIRISILQGSSAGTEVYVETHTTTTNANGLVSLEIGNGTVVSGTFDAIDWSNGPFFIKTETDPAGGTNYSIIGTSQLLSVPYALYAKTSGSSAPGPQGIQGVAGMDGADGENGQNSLIKSTIEAAGINCETGGIKLEYGIDANNDGTLDVSEINASLTKYICNGAQGAQGPAGTTGATGETGVQGPAGTQGIQGNPGANGQNSLVKTTTEAAGANCTTGGIKLEYGLDANNNGTLDASEINASLTKYICNGTQGIQGTTGATGTAGTNGQNSLSKTTTEAAGANCSTGGVKVEYGLDANNNGTLDAVEVNALLTRYICNGAQGTQGIQGNPGTNGQNSLSKTTTEAAGANCATGGVKVEYGLDANNNGILDASEINAALTRYVCNGAQGATGATGANGKNTIVKTTTESAGSNCPGGGVKLEYGLDANSNGTLETAEVDASLTKYVCNGDPGQHPVYLKTVMGTPFTINVGNGAIAMVRFYTQCAASTAGGLIYIENNGNITVMSTAGSQGANLTASGNVLSLNTGCIDPWTFTFTVSGGIATVTQGGGGGFHQDGKWQILGN